MNKTSTKRIIEPKSAAMNETSDDNRDFPFEPGKQVINNILNYSKALSIRKSQSGEHFEMVLN